MRLDLNSDSIVLGDNEMLSSARNHLMLMILALAFLAAGIVGCTAEPQGEREKTKGEPSARVAETSSDDHRKTEKAHKDEHEGHEHEGEGHEEHERVVNLSPEEIEEFGIKLKKAEPGKLHPTLSLTGEVMFNPDKVVHVRPRVPGVVREVFTSVGDKVESGDLLAVLDSAEFAKAKSEYLEALTREDLEKTNFEREEKLWKDQVSSEKDYLGAKQAHREAIIRRERAERALHTLGLSEKDLIRLPAQEHKDLSRYEITSPMNGTVIKRHLVRGEVLHGNGEESPFVLADMSSVWVNLTVHQKDLTTVKKGQEVRISFGKHVPEASGVIDYVSPAMEESTRTATARVILENRRGHWRPGLFVTGHVHVSEELSEVLVTKTAILTLDGKPVVFVKTDEGFEPRQVKTGQEDRTHAEILKGVKAGEIYVAENGFTLKAELKKESFAGEGHEH